MKKVPLYSVNPRLYDMVLKELRSLFSTNIQVVYDEEVDLVSRSNAKQIYPPIIVSSEYQIFSEIHNVKVNFGPEDGEKEFQISLEASFGSDQENVVFRLVEDPC